MNDRQRRDRPEAQRNRDKWRHAEPYTEDMTFAETAAITLTTQHWWRHISNRYGNFPEIKRGESIAEALETLSEMASDLAKEYRRLARSMGQEETQEKTA